MSLPGTVLFVAAALAQLCGLGLVALDVRDARRAARGWLHGAQAIAEHGKDFFSRGLGAADMNASWALAQIEALQRTLAAGVLSESRRSVVGAVLIGVGIVLATVAGLLG